MSDRSDASRWDVPRHARIATRTKAIASIAVAIASLNGLVACSGDDSSPNTDGGAQRDGAADGTVQPADGGSDTGTVDSTTNDSSAADAGTDAELVIDSGHTKPDTSGPTGDAGQPCTPPLNTCGPDLFCNSSRVCTPSYCSGKPQKALPYALGSDFQTVFTIGPEKPNFTLVQSGADCDSTTYPPIPNTGLGDGGPAPEAGFPTLTDGGTEIVTYPAAPSCYEFLYDPSCVAGAQGVCWAGAIFTNSAATAAAASNGNVTSSAIGVCVARGATVISFWARSSRDGAVVKFGSSRPGACSQNPITSADGGPPDPETEQTQCPNATEFFIALTTDWRQYTVSLGPSEPYNDEPGAGGGVWNGFSVVVEPAPFAGGAYIFVKDIVWGSSVAAPDAGAPDAGGDVSVADAASE